MNTRVSRALRACFTCTYSCRNSQCSGGPHACMCLGHTVHAGLLCRENTGPSHLAVGQGMSLDTHQGAPCVCSDQSPSINTTEQSSFADVKTTLAMVG